MRKILLLLLGVLVFSCSNNEIVDNTKKDTDNPFLKDRESISQLAFNKYKGNITDESFQVSLDGILGVGSNCKLTNLPKTRSAAVLQLDSISSKEGKELFYEIINTEPTDFNSPEEYTQGLIKLLYASKVQKKSTEFYIFESAIQYSSDLLINKMNYLDPSVSTRAMARKWTAWGRCAAGIFGSGILGGLTGAATGSTVPGLGTTAGAIWGMIGGGLTGAATFC